MTTKHCYILNTQAVSLMVSEKKIIKVKKDCPGHGQFGPQELDWQDLCTGPLNIATY